MGSRRTGSERRAGGTEWDPPPAAGSEEEDLKVKTEETWDRRDEEPTWTEEGRARGRTAEAGVSLFRVALRGAKSEDESSTPGIPSSEEGDSEENLSDSFGHEPGTTLPPPSRRRLREPTGLPEAAAVPQGSSASYPSSSTMVGRSRQRCFAFTK